VYSVLQLIPEHSCLFSYKACTHRDFLWQAVCPGTR